MQPGTAISSVWNGRRAGGLLAIVAVGAALRLAKLDGLSLTYDELQSVAHASRPFPLSLLVTQMFDPHPPIYYMLLSVWLGVARSDTAILLSSTLIGVALVPSVFYVGLRLYGARVAWLAAIVCAAHPLALFWSHHVRMYGLVMLLTVWSFYLGVRHAERGGRRLLAGVLASDVALLYTHASAMFALAFVWIFVLREHVRSRSALRRFAAARGVAIGLWLPVAISLAPVDLGHMLEPGPVEIVKTLALFVGGVGSPSPVLILSAALAFVAAVLLLLYRPRERTFASSFLVAPFVAGAVVSHVVRPMWFGSRTFAFLLPFVAIAFAKLYAGAGTGRLGLASRAVAIAAAVVAAGGVLHHTLFWQKPDRFIDAARAVRAEVQPGDVVAVPNLSAKWAFNWYFEGPGWDRGLWGGPAGEQFEALIRADGRRDLRRRMAWYRPEPVDEHVLVLPVDEGVSVPTDRAARVWIIARTPDMRAGMARALGLDGRPHRGVVPDASVTLWTRQAP